MSKLRHSLPLVAGLLTGSGCAPGPCPPGSTRTADGLCTLLDDTDADASTTDTGMGADPQPTAGDPIRVVGFEGDDAPGQRLLEWTDAAILDESTGAVCGVAGVGLVDLTQGTTIAMRPTPPCLRMAEDDGVLIASDRATNITVLDVSSPPDLNEMGFIRFLEGDTRHEDVAIHDRRILVGWHGNGAPLYDPQANLLGTLPATDAFAVGLHGDRAVISDGEELVLWDVTDPAFATELSRVPLPGEGRDIEFDGGRVAVAMGGRGVGVWDVQDDVLVERDTMVVPGAGLAIALDGDDVWVGSWEHTVLLRLTDTGLVSVGHEAPRYSAMGIAAEGGTALVGDWHGHMTLTREPGVAAPEIIIDQQLYFSEAEPSQRVRIENHGELALEWALDGAVAGFTVEPERATVEPGGVQFVQVTGAPPDGQLLPLAWSSNDPDESAGQIVLGSVTDGVGAEHADFSLQGFVWPSRDLAEYTLSAERGKVVVLAYFALY
jgi:hypothetical protein